MEGIEVPPGSPVEGDDAADIVFPSGKSSGVKEGLRPLPKKQRGNNLAKGNYGVKSSHTRKRHSSPEPKRTPLQSGLHKMMEASVRFNPEKDGMLKQGFAGQGLTPPEFREMLRRLFNIKLNEMELGAVFAHFVPDGGMELDGKVFIVHFIQVMSGVCCVLSRSTCLNYRIVCIFITSI